MAAVSNEAMYRRNWSRFVDSVIAQRAALGGREAKQGNSATEKIELRDLTWLELLLSKLEIKEDSGPSSSCGQQRKEGRRGSAELRRAKHGCDSEDCRKGVAKGVDLKEMDRKPLAELTRSSRVTNSPSTERRHPSFLCAQSASGRPVLAVTPVGSPRMVSGADTIGVGRPSMGAQSPMCSLANLEYSKPSDVAEVDVVVANIKVQREEDDCFRGKTNATHSPIAIGDDTHGGSAKQDIPRMIDVTEHVNFSSTGRAIVPGASPPRREDRGAPGGFVADEDQARADSSVQHNPDWDETRIIESNENADDMHMTSTTEELLVLEQLVDGQFGPPTADECDMSGEGGMLGVTVLDCSHRLHDSRRDGSVMHVTADRDSAIMNSTSSRCPSPRGLSLEAAIFMSVAPESIQDAGQACGSRGSPAIPATIVHSPIAKEGILVNSHEVASSCEKAASNNARSPHSPVSHVLDDSPNRANKEDAVLVASPQQSPRVRPRREVVSSGQADTEVWGLNEGDPDETYLSENCVESPEILRLASTARKSSWHGGVDGSRQEPVFKTRNHGLTDGREAAKYNRRSDAESFIYAVPNSLGASEERSETFASQLGPGIAGAFGLDADDAPSPVARIPDPHFAGDVDFEDHTAWASTTSEGPGIFSSPAKSEASAMSLILTPDRLRSGCDAVDASMWKNVIEPKQTPTARGVLLQQSSPPAFTGHDAEAEEGMRAVPPPESLSFNPQNQLLLGGYASARPSRETSRRKGRTPNTRAGTQQSKRCNSGSSNSVERPALNDRSPLQAVVNPEVRRHQCRRTPEAQARRSRQEAPTLDSPPSSSDSRREESSAASPRRIDEHLSITFITESEVVDHISVSHRECADGELKIGSSERKGPIAAGDVSLIKGTPRRRERGERSASDRSGFDAPLSVTYPMKMHTEDPSLSAVQRGILEWMRWRETGSSGGKREEASAGLSRTTESPTVTEHGLQSDALGDGVVIGGMLAHLPCEEASECLMALIQGQTLGTSSGRLGRPGVEHPWTGLPHGATLVIAAGKEAAAKWSDRLTVSRCGLSVLNYVMSLRE